MTIMRSEEKRQKMKDIGKKVKRPRVDWMSIIKSINNVDKRNAVLKDYWIITHRGSIKSKNRRAYNAIKKHYSTTTLLLVRYGLDIN